MLPKFPGGFHVFNADFRSFWRPWGGVDFLHRLLYDNDHISRGITMKPGPSTDLGIKEKVKFSILEKDISASGSSNVVIIAAIRLQFRPTIRSGLFQKSY